MSTADEFVPAAADAELFHLTRPSYEAFVAYAKDPEQFVKAMWSSVLGELKGGRHFEAKLRTRAEVPLSEFELSEFADYQPSLEAARRSRVSPLTGQPILWWGKSTGTTSLNKKLIPYTPATLDNFRRIELLRIHDDLRKFSCEGAPYRQVRLNGLQPELHPATGIPMGMMTAFAHAYASDVVSATRSIPYEAYKDSATFKAWAPLYALASHARVLTGVTALPVTTLLRDVFAHLPDWMPYLSGEKALPPELPALRLEPGRLQLLTALVARSGSAPLTAMDLWPTLRGVCCWATGASKTLLDELRPLLGAQLPIFHLGYGCTEGVVAQPAMSSEVPAGPVSFFGIVEFLPAAGPARTENLLQVWELKTGGRYIPVITNRTGLVRYRIDDIVSCSGHFHGVPLVQFVQRADSAIPMGFGFFLEEDLLGAMQAAAVELRSRWLFAPRVGSKGLELIHDAPGLDPADPVFERLDRAIADIHPVYRGLRASGALEKFRGHFVPPAHEFWAAFEPKHAQSKRAVLIKEPPNL